MTKFNSVVLFVFRHSSFVIRASSFPPVAHSPDRLVRVLAEEQAAVFRDRDSDRPPPHISFRRDEAGYEVFVIAARFAGRLVERDADDFVSSATLAVPRAVKRGEDVAFVFGGKLRAVVEAKIQRRRMTLDEDIGHENFAG